MDSGRREQNGQEDGLEAGGLGVELVKGEDGLVKGAEKGGACEHSDSFAAAPAPAALSYVDNCPAHVVTGEHALPAARVGMYFQDAK